MPIQTFGFRVWEYLSYRLRSVGPHALHSPFLYDLHAKAIKPASRHKVPAIETLRRELEADPSIIELTDYKSGKTKMSTMGSVAKRSASNARFASFLSLLIKQVAANTVLETGTSFGFTTCYLAVNAPRVVTIEGSSALASISHKHFDHLGFNNIDQVNADLYEILEKEIVKNNPDFYFLDADHRSSSIAFCIDLILKHTPAAKCIVIHDIYWSKDMKMMWKSLVQDPRFTLSIDLFQAGLLFPTMNMEKQHFTLRF